MLMMRGVGLVVAMALAMVGSGLVAGCGKSFGDSENDDRASGGAGAASSGGSRSMSDGGSGGVEMDFTPPKATMTEAEWLAAQAPYTTAHEIWTGDACLEPSVASNELLGQEYPILPRVSCSYVVEGYGRCAIIPSCESSADCTEAARGRCEGGVVEPQCHYPDSALKCSENDDCTMFPNGLCSFGSWWTCYPTGECVPPAGYCYDPDNADYPCQADADCTAAEGGKCWGGIKSTCSYGTCFQDDDCETGKECSCGRCQEDACLSDEECGDDESCVLDQPCGDHGGYHCTTSSDECEPEPIDCIYGDGKWFVAGICE